MEDLITICHRIIDDQRTQMDLNRNVYEFVIAYQSENEVEALQNSETAAPPSKKELLPNGQPNFKVLFTLASSEEEAFHKVDAYVKSTSYKEIEDRKTI